MALRCPPPRRAGPKLTLDQVRDIARLASQGFTRRDLAETYGVGPSMIGHILSGRCWGGLSGAVPTPGPRRRGDTERAEIVRLKSEGLTGAEIAEALDVSPATVWRILAQSRAAADQ